MNLLPSLSLILPGSVSFNPTALTSTAQNSQVFMASGPLYHLLFRLQNSFPGEPQAYFHISFRYLLKCALSVRLSPNTAETGDGCLPREPIPVFFTIPLTHGPSKHCSCSSFSVWCDRLIDEDRAPGFLQCSILKLDSRECVRDRGWTLSKDCISQLIT